MGNYIFKQWEQQGFSIDHGYIHGKNRYIVDRNVYASNKSRAICDLKQNTFGIYISGQWSPQGFSIYHGYISERNRYILRTSDYHWQVNIKLGLLTFTTQQKILGL